LIAAIGAADLDHLAEPAADLARVVRGFAASHASGFGTKLRSRMCAQCPLLQENRK
jgi:hypothetical protein